MLRTLDCHPIHFQVKFAPNIFIMEYLEATNQDNREIKFKAVEFMKTGYQRELTYRHEDGSYSAFGKNDDSGGFIRMHCDSWFNCLFICHTFDDKAGS